MGSQRNSETASGEGDAGDTAAPPGEKTRMREARETVERIRLHAIAHWIHELRKTEKER